nr:uncharacterized protein LOC111511762 [Leptinotarsa decemlineata]
MQFLEKCYDSRDTEESIDYSVTTEIDNTESIHEKPDEYENTGEIIKEVNVPANRMIRRRRKPDEVDTAVLKASEQPQQQPDTNMSFFHSLKPHLKQFDDSQILQFQIAVLEIISEIKEKEKMTQAPAFPTIPQHCCSHVPLHQQSPKPLSHQHHSSLRCCMQQHHPYNSYHSSQECGIQTNVTPSSTTELSQYNQPIYQSLNITPKVVSGNKPSSCTSGQILTSTQTSQPVIISETASNYECFDKTSDDNTSLSIIRVDSPFSDNSETFDFGN